MVITPARIIEKLRYKLPDRLKLKQKLISMINEKSSPLASSGFTENLAYVDLAMDNVMSAHEHYKTSVNYILTNSKAVMDLAPGMVRSPSLGWPWTLYFGLYGHSVDKTIEHYRLIISETEKEEGPQLDEINIGSYLAYISLTIIIYLINDRDHLKMYLTRIFNQTEKYSNITLDEITSKPKDTEKFVGYYTRARGYIIKGLVDEDPNLVKHGLEITSNIHKKFVKYSDVPESIVDRPLIILYDQAKSKWPDFYFETPFIPKSILEKGYWNQLMGEKKDGE